jgi:hypothetical protein
MFIPVYGQTANPPLNKQINAGPTSENTRASTKTLRKELAEHITGQPAGKLPGTFECIKKRCRVSADTARLCLQLSKA